MWLGVGLLAIGLAASGPDESTRTTGIKKDDLDAAPIRALASREYRAGRGDRGLQAPNRAHGFRTYFGPEGIRIHDRRKSASPPHFSLTLRRFGRASAPRGVGPGTLVAGPDRVEIRRPDLVEWYRNSPAGLEQGFTLARPPRTAGIGSTAERDTDPVILEMELDGGEVTLGDRDAAIVVPAGATFRYGELFAFDATGRELPLHLESPSADTLRLVLHDRGARYPVVVDPLISAVFSHEVRSGETDSQLGFSVAGAGDVNDDGYDDVIVGAYRWDGGEADEGAAFLLLGGPMGITGADPAAADAVFQADLAGAEMGISVAGAGDVNDDGYDDVIVGARSYTDVNDGGAAFLFYGSAAGIPSGNPSSAGASLLSDLGGALFGASVAGAGDVNDDGYDDVIVGAYQYTAGQSTEGAAFVFLGSASGVSSGDASSADARLEGDQSLALFGLSVAGAGDVNADGYDDVIVGAPFYDDGEDGEGAAFVFLGGASGIGDAGAGAADARLQSDQVAANFGFHVAGAGDVDADGYGDVVVGADEFDAGEDSEGAAFLFAGSATGIASAGPGGAAAQLESNQPGADFGISVAGAGDVDGDGYGDVLVGANLWNAGSDEVGAAFLYRGGPGGIASGGPEQASHQLTGVGDGSGFGVSVAGAGDVDGDGRDEVLVGANEATLETADEGVVYVFQTLFDPFPVPALGTFGALALCGALVWAARRGVRPRG